MTDEQINTAIAETCGWTVDKRGLGWLSPAGCYTDKPNYCNDLNVMREAEMMLSDERIYIMAHYIERDTARRGQHWLQATARQRAEAFLRTLGKWEEVQG